MTKQMLRGIRVNSKQELIDRIYLYFQEINKEPVVYHWKYKMDEITGDEIGTIWHGIYLMVNLLAVLYMILSQKFSCSLIGRPEKFFRRCLLHNNTLIHENHPVGYIFGKIHLMGYDYHGHLLFCQLCDNL